VSGSRPLERSLSRACPPPGLTDWPSPGLIDWPPPEPTERPPREPIERPPPASIDLPPPGPIESQPPGPIELGTHSRQACAEAPETQNVDSIAIAKTAGKNVRRIQLPPFTRYLARRRRESLYSSLRPRKRARNGLAAVVAIQGSWNKTSGQWPNRRRASSGPFCHITSPTPIRLSPAIQPDATGNLSSSANFG
jgi:hypothetical protein